MPSLGKVCHYTAESIKNRQPVGQITKRGNSPVDTTLSVFFQFLSRVGTKKEEGRKRETQLIWAKFHKVVKQKMLLSKCLCEAKQE